MISEPESNLNSTLKPESDGSAGVYPNLSRDVSEMEIDERTVLEQEYNRQPQNSFGISSGHAPNAPSDHQRGYHGVRGPRVLPDPVHHNINQSHMNRGGHQIDPASFECSMCLGKYY